MPEQKTINLEDFLQKDDPEFLITDDIMMLDGEITQEKAKNIVAYITQANFAENPPPFMTIVVNSPGGDMEATFAMISAMRASRFPIYTVAMGICASGGLMLAISGNKRFIDKYCTVMSHTLSTGYHDFAKPSDLNRWMSSVRSCADRMVSHYKDTTKLSDQKIRRKLLPEDGDVWLSAEQALSYGLFDSYFTSYDQLS